MSKCIFVCIFFVRSYISKNSFIFLTTKRCGHLPMDIIFQRYLPNCIILKLINDKNVFQYVIPYQYHWFHDEAYEPWIFNPEWCVIPSISFFKNKGPVIISFRDHKKGPIFHIICPFCQPLHILLSKYYNQLAPNSTQRKPIKPIKTSTHSNQFQIHE